MWYNALRGLEKANWPKSSRRRRTDRTRHDCARHDAVGRGGQAGLSTRISHLERASRRAATSTSGTVLPTPLPVSTPRRIRLRSRHAGPHGNASSLTTSYRGPFRRSARGLATAGSGDDVGHPGAGCRTQLPWSHRVHQRETSHETGHPISRKALIFLR